MKQYADEQCLMNLKLATMKQDPPYKDDGKDLYGSKIPKIGSSDTMLKYDRYI